MIYFLLPAYNEEDAITPLTEKIAAAMAEIGAAYQIVVVNDGSRDRTLERCRELSGRYSMHIISHKINREVVLMVDHPLIYARLLEVFLHDWAFVTR